LALEPHDHLLELPCEDSSVLEGKADALLIARTSALSPTHLSPHQLTQGDAHRGRPQAGAEGAPDLVADLHTGHAVALRPGVRIGPFGT